MLCLLFLTPFNQNEKVLVFTKTAGYRHESIEKGVETIIELGKENDFDITHSEDANIFNKGNLSQYELVIFLNTTEDILNLEQQILM